jgi:hypothetical protein
MLVYLSGSIEYAHDKGTTWRASLTPFLRSLGHEVYDPAADVKKNLSDEEVRDFRKWKATDLDRFQGTIRKIIAWDLDYVEHKCDYIVAFWDEGAQRGAGTGGELTLAHRRGIPVYMVAGVPIDQISGWILGCATEVFTNFEHLQAFLAQKYALVDVEFGKKSGKGTTIDAEFGKGTTSVVPLAPST